MPAICELDLGLVSTDAGVHSRMRVNGQSVKSALTLAGLPIEIAAGPLENLRGIGECLIFCASEPYLDQEAEYGDQERDFR